MANNELIDEVISTILMNSHEQASWAQATTKSDTVKPDVNDPSCGTTACIAGWTCIVTGQLFKWSFVSWEEDENGNPFALWDAQYTADNEEISTAAREALGLSYDEAQLIFHTMGEDEAIDLLKRVKNGEQIVEPEYDEYEDYEECPCDACTNGEPF